MRDIHFNGDQTYDDVDDHDADDDEFTSLCILINFIMVVMSQPLAKLYYSILQLFKERLSVNDFFHVCFVHFAPHKAHWVQSNSVKQEMILPKIKVG